MKHKRSGRSPPTTVARPGAKKITDPFIPDELVVDIVSRLPAEDVIRCRSVCKGWMILTSTQEFSDLHMMHHRRRQKEGNFRPLIIFERGNKEIGFMRILIEKRWEATMTMPTRSSLEKMVFLSTVYDEYRMQFSVDGLIVLKQSQLGLQVGHSCSNYIILNPINGENVKISLSIEMNESIILGLFFHPSLMEYCTLWQVPTDLPSPEYKLLNLGPRPCWRNIKNRLPEGNKYWIRRKKLLYVENCIYWIVYDDREIEILDGFRNNIPVDFEIPAFTKIVEFDVTNEKMTMIKAPVEDCYYIGKRLLNNGGSLSMVEVHPEYHVLVACISTLINRSSQVWVKARFCFNDNILGHQWPLYNEAIAVADKQLVFFSNEGIFVCNLELGTVKRFFTTLGDNPKFFPHVITLASLKGCKSEFCMGYNDEVKCDTQWFRVPRRHIS